MQWDLAQQTALIDAALVTSTGHGVLLLQKNSIFLPITAVDVKDPTVAEGEVF